MRNYICLLLIFSMGFLGCRREYQTGEEGFREACAKCHTLNGKGGSKGPDLADIFTRKDEFSIRTYIMDPRSIKGDGTMPPAKISDRELDLIVEYLKEKGRIP